MKKFYLNKLRENDYKITPKRRAIVSLFLKADKYLSPETVRNKLKKQFKHLGLPSIYRNLGLMAECGILTRIQRPDQRLNYGLCREMENKHHHHIICVKCGKVREFSECRLFKRKVIDGFEIAGHFLQLEGVCPECRKAEGVPRL